MKLNSSGRCVADDLTPGCDGIVRNIDGKRHTVERLTEIHAETCPAANRKRKASSS